MTTQKNPAKVVIIFSLAIILGFFLFSVSQTKFFEEWIVKKACGEELQQNIDPVEKMARDIRKKFADKNYKEVVSFYDMAMDLYGNKIAEKVGDLYSASLKIIEMTWLKRICDTYNEGRYLMAFFMIRDLQEFLLKHHSPPSQQFHDVKEGIEEDLPKEKIRGEYSV